MNECKSFGRFPHSLCCRLKPSTENMSGKTSPGRVPDNESTPSTFLRGFIWHCTAWPLDSHTSSAAEGVVEDLLAGVAVQRKRRPRPPCPEPTHRCRSASQRVCVVLGQDVDQAASTLRLYACGRKVNVVDVCPSFLFPLLLFVSVGGVREKK